ncbi:MAG: plasmid pRiA4b ORF-3 family protein [Flavobacteriales bacterium]|nr:plasmid pRiA4b ORF-3 family protein [Flavobacteriales bacterium]HRN36789.1 hypothetical protein [Flavobacteriales bacterium]HRO39649.1 hypothetical protein [Flavobacteriales bacterium]HRP81988.1 hypothetical protein [Flavobacteriales bacterium]
MLIYRFRVLIDDASEAFRDIEIGSGQSFLEFHRAIKEAFGFTSDEMACFYVSDAEWNKGIEIPLADMGFAEEGKMPLMMHEVEVGDHIRDADQRFVYAYDFLTMWMFLVERIGTGDPDPALTYPRVAMSVGKAPSERSRNALLGMDLEEEEFNGSHDGDDPYDEDDEDEHYGGSIDDLGDEYR